MEYYSRIDMKKNIGIFLAYAPEQSIKSHGISRLLSFMLAGMLENDDTQVTIATPAWFKENITQFMKDQAIPVEKVKLLTTPGIPYLLRIKQFLSRRKNSDVRSIPSQETTYFKRLKSSGKKHLLNLFMHWMSIYSTPLFITVTLLFCLLGIMLFPLFFIAVVGYLCIGLLKKFCHLSKKFSEFIYHKPHRFLKNNPVTRIFFLQMAELKRNIVARVLYSELRTRELNKLIRMINARPDIPVWFIPTLFWPEIKAIKAKKVIAAPDIVFVDFPTHFADPGSAETYKKITDTIAAGDHFICYSEYVKQKHLIHAFRVIPDKITVIPHGAIDLSPVLKKNRSQVTLQNQSIQILRQYQKTDLAYHPYLSDYNLGDMRFIFYSSQLRPYKNFHNLIRAYEILLRERFVNVKLIVTGDIKSDPGLYQYILDKRLQFDVLSFYDIPSDVLAALNHLAVCAVNPTLFEGGFPFTFTEAYSVGTPSVMSAIPAVTVDVKEEDLHQRMLFDPYNVDDMVNKIEWAIKNRSKLLELQAPLYQRFKERNWGLVAKEYVNLLTDFSYATP